MTDAMNPPGDTDNQEAHPMDTLNDHAARISARIEEYKTLDLIGRNSADDLQHHLRALVAERDEANARADAVECERNCLEQLVSHLRGIGRANASDTQAYWDSVDTAYKAVYGDLDGAPGDTAGERTP